MKLEASRQLDRLIHYLEGHKIKGRIVVEVFGNHGELTKIHTDIGNYISPEDV